MKSFTPFCFFLRIINISIKNSHVLFTTFCIFFNVFFAFIFKNIDFNFFITSPLNYILFCSLLATRFSRNWYSKRRDKCHRCQHPIIYNLATCTLIWYRLSVVLLLPCHRFVTMLVIRRTKERINE